MKIANLSNDNFNSIICRPLEDALISIENLGITVKEEFLVMD